jgi:phage gpG-like protein
MPDLDLVDTASPALAAMPERIRAALTAKAGTLAAELQTKIAQKLSGEVLATKSGALAGSISVMIEDSLYGVTVRLATSPDVKYAAIHEFGGAIPPHEIVTDKAKALVFLVGGKQAFAARVLVPAVTVPERSYMRSSLAEMAGAISDEFDVAIVEVMQ